MGMDFESVESSNILFIFKMFLFRDSVRVEVFRPFGDVGECPIPEREHHEVFADTGFSFRGGLSDNHFANNTFAEGKNTHEIGMKKHTIAEIAKLLVYIESLACHVDFYMVMTLELEEVTDSGFEYLVIAIIPNHANFIEQEQGTSFRDELTKVLDIKMTDTGHEQLFHVGIDYPSLFHVLLCQFDKVCTLTGAFLTKDQIELIGVEIFPGQKMPSHKESHDNSINCQKCFHMSPLNLHFQNEYKNAPAPPRRWAGAFF